MKRLLLVRHAPTEATSASRFPTLEDDVSIAVARDGYALPAGARALCSTAARTKATAEAFGLIPSVDPLLDECDFGKWAGRSVADVQAREPEHFGRWLGDPDAAPHGGESLNQMAARVRRFLVNASSLEGTTIAFTHGGFIKIAVALALDAPLAAMWRIDVAPLSITELERFDTGWTLRRVNWSPARAV